MVGDTIMDPIGENKVGGNGLPIHPGHIHRTVVCLRLRIHNNQSIPMMNAQIPKADRPYFSQTAPYFIVELNIYLAQVIPFLPNG